jgi:predicted MFS family arabinose efflux permease
MSSPATTQPTAPPASPEPAAAETAAASIQRDWLLLAAATVAFGIGFGINSGAAQNYAVQALNLTRVDLSRLESMREIPGLLTAVMVGLASMITVLTAPRLAALSLAFVAVGIACIGQAGSFWPLVACNLCWSVGLHIWLTVQPSLTLSLSREGHHGHGLGLMMRYQTLAVMVGLAFVLLGSRIKLGYPATFLAAGVAIAAGCFLVARIPASRGGEVRQHLVFRPEYWRYYGLMLLDGGRRQVVQTFALLILIKEFGVGLGAVATLQLFNNALTMWAAPMVGRWTDRLGERRVLGTYYCLVVVIFFGYTQINGLSSAWGLRPEWIFYALFAVDNLLFTASVGIQTYIRHVAPPEELAPSLAMGLTWNHIAAVSVPLIAGQIWATYGYAVIFRCGIVLALCSVAMCLTLPRRPAALSNPAA